MAKMSPEYLEKFLSQTRYGMLTTLAADGSPRSVPIWFDWDGSAVRIVTAVNTAKVKRIQRDARITVLVASHPDEDEAWVALEGDAKIQSGGIDELLERMAAKYWDMSNPELRSTVDSWKSEPDDLCVIELVPTKIRSQQD